MVTSPSVNSLASAASHSGFSTNRSPVQTMTGPTASTSTFALTASTSSTTLDTDPPKRKFINFFKRHLSAEIIRDIQQYQSQPYNLAKCKPVQDFLAAGLQKVEAAGDMYDRSLLLEPREREEERM
jgi:son of sevenless-like protein